MSDERESLITALIITLVVLMVCIFATCGRWG